MSEEIKVESVSFGELDSAEEREGNRETFDFSNILANDKQAEGIKEEEEKKTPNIPDFSNVLAVDKKRLEDSEPESEPESELEPELVQKSKITPENEDFIDRATETLRKMEKEEEEKDKEPLKDFPLEEMKIEKIVGISGLQPMVIYAKMEGVENPVGFPGFFDERNQVFMMAEVNPVSAQNFKEIFSEFLKNVSLKKEEDTGGE